MILPQIPTPTFIWVIIWSILGMAIGSIGWSNNKKNRYKDFLSGTIGISLEAFGMEVAKIGATSFILPLLSAIIFALWIRNLPDEDYELQFNF